MKMNLLVKNIGMLVGIDESGRTARCGAELNEIGTLEKCVAVD